MKVTLLFFCSLFILIPGCATKEITPTGIEVQSESQYVKVIESHTEEDQKYDGLHNIIDLKATIINSSVAEAQADQTARMFLWDKTKYDAEFIKTTADLNKQTKIFISFFTPEKKHNELHKNNSIWKIFLDVDGKRYEGTASKTKQLTRELGNYYPYHTQFSNPYYLTFPISTKDVEKKTSKLTITGPLGSVSVEFKPLH